MKQNYVYKVNKTGRVYADLDGAIQEATNDMWDCLCCGWHQVIGCGSRFSNPIVVKVQGGYKVMVTDYLGNVYYRNIDVFKPTKESGSKWRYHFDQCR